jgi:hypothetical protein
MAITYTPATNFGAKDTLPTNDPGKVIKGAEFTTEFNAIQTAFGFAAPAASPALTGTVSLNGTGVNAILDEDNMASDSDTALATQQSIKAYVDSAVGSPTVDLTPSVDNSLDLGSASKRWADLYLSGGIYIGGTTSANYLDDYEVGTWTTTLNNDPANGTVSSRSGWYIKIGDTVNLFFKLVGSNMEITAAQTFADYNGIPFAANSSKSGTYAGHWTDGVSFGARADRSFSAAVYLTWLALGRSAGNTFNTIVSTVVYEAN